MEINREHIEKAKRILPLATKLAIIKSSVKDCIEEITIKDKSIPYFKEDVFTKEMIFVKVLLSNYLNIVAEDEVLTLEKYDKYCENNPINQLERLKNKFKAEKEFELVEKIFDLITDYNKFCKMFNVEIYSYLQINNTINDERFATLVAEKIADKTIESLTDKIAKQVTPEAFQEAAKDFTETINKARTVLDKTGK